MSCPIVAGASAMVSRPRFARNRPRIGAVTHQRFDLLGKTIPSTIRVQRTWFCVQHCLPPDFVRADTSAEGGHPRLKHACCFRGDVSLLAVTSPNLAVVGVFRGFCSCSIPQVRQYFMESEFYAADLAARGFCDDWAGCEALTPSSATVKVGFPLVTLSREPYLLASSRLHCFVYRELHAGVV